MWAKEGHANWGIGVTLGGYAGLQRVRHRQGSPRKGVTESHRGREGLEQEEWKQVKTSYPMDIGQSHTSISGQTDSMAN